MILCVHIVELDLLTWWQITEKYVVNGMSANIQLILIIAGKVLLDLGGAFVLSKITLVFIVQRISIKRPMKTFQSTSLI